MPFQNFGLPLPPSSCMGRWVERWKFAKFFFLFLSVPLHSLPSFLPSSTTFRLELSDERGDREGEERERERERRPLLPLQGKEEPWRSGEGQEQKERIYMAVSYLSLHFCRKDKRKKNGRRTFAQLNMLIFPGKMVGVLAQKLFSCPKLVNNPTQKKNPTTLLIHLLSSLTVQ